MPKNLKLTNPELLKRRRDICNSCPHKIINSLCEKCGCVIYVKTLLDTNHCPINKW